MRRRSLQDGSWIDSSDEDIGNSFTFAFGKNEINDSREKLACMLIMEIVGALIGRDRDIFEERDCGTIGCVSVALRRNGVCKCSLRELKGSELFAVQKLVV